MNILVAGDYCSNGRLKMCSLVEKGIVDSKLSCLIRESDYALVNLECPLFTEENGTSYNAIHKQGPTLFGALHNLDVLKTIGFSCVTLANNHIMDYGEGALNETLKGLAEREFDSIGAGRNIDEASRILYKTFEGVSAAFINCCEHEFSIATNTHGGANPLNPMTQFYQIKEAQNYADYVIMIIHGGVEHFQYPTTRMVDTYRFFVDAGADVVINHHQHCPCGYEIYHNKPIFYGLGNFCFDWEGNRNSIWNLGYMVILHLEGNHQINSEIIPYRQCDETPTLNLLDGKELDDFNCMMKDLCEAIQNPDILEAKLKEYNVRNDYLYRKMLEPYSGRVTNGMYRRGWLPSTINKERVLALMDFLICESHHERVKELLERLYKQYYNE